MLIAILIITTIGLILILFSLREMHNKINNLEIKLDEVKEKTDKLGTYNY